MVRRSEAGFLQQLAEAGRFHMGTGKVHETVKTLAADPERERIDYALIGAMALNAHGYRRETVAVDVLLRPEGRDKFIDLCVGRGYRPTFPGARKSFRNNRTGVAVEFVTTGEFPGHGKPKPVAFPEPSVVSVLVDGVRVVDLPTLVNLKLASGMTQASRMRDLADVQDLIRTLKLPESFAADVNPYVQEMFLTLFRQAGEPDPHREAPAP